MGTMSEEQVMRKQPKQARSQRRVDQILDGAAQIFAETGYEHATTNAIAARAGVSIGSLYQFFPNKEAVMDALTERYTEGMREIMSFDPALSVTENICGFVDRFAYFESTHAGFRPIFMTLGKTTVLHEEIVARVEAVLAHYFPSFDALERDRSARVMVAIVKGLMPLIHPPDSLPGEYLLQEIKAALKAYVRSVVIREGHPPPHDLV